MPPSSVSTSPGNCTSAHQHHFYPACLLGPHQRLSSQFPLHGVSEQCDFQTSFPHTPLSLISLNSNSWSPCLEHPSWTLPLLPATHLAACALAHRCGEAPLLSILCFSHQTSELPLPLPEELHSQWAATSLSLGPASHGLLGVLQPAELVPKLVCWASAKGHTSGLCPSPSPLLPPSKSPISFQMHSASGHSRSIICPSPAPYFQPPTGLL